MKDAARAQRKEQTAAEQHLWRFLRKRGLGGYRFRQQHPIGPFILDFYCHEARLAVEVDGPYHCDEDQSRHDHERDDDLAGAGIATLRFSSEEVLSDTDGVLAAIRAYFDASL